MRQTKGGDVFIRHKGYQVSNLYVGFVWKGVAVLGVDVDDDAWGLVIWHYYAGYKFRDG